MDRHNRFDHDVIWWPLRENLIRLPSGGQSWQMWLVCHLMASFLLTLFVSTIVQDDKYGQGHCFSWLFNKNCATGLGRWKLHILNATLNPLSPCSPLHGFSILFIIWSIVNAELYCQTVHLKHWRCRFQEDISFLPAATVGAVRSTYCN